jgi:hypothetical protein
LIFNIKLGTNKYKYRGMATSTAQETFSNTEKLNKILKFIYGLIIFIGCYSIYSNIFQLNILSQVLDGATISQDVIEASDGRQALIAISQLLTSIIGFIVFLFWFYRSHKNIQTLYSEPTEFSNKKAVGNWFIPFYNLFRPFKSMKEIWGISNPNYEPPKSQPIISKGTNLIGIWWGLFMLRNVIGQITWRFDLGTDTLEGLYNATFLFIATDILHIAIIGIELYLITSITKWQTTYVDHGFATSSIVKS